VTAKGDGLCIQWLKEHSSYPRQDWCLIWPFSTARGYGHFGHLGVSYYAHVYMCELVHGPAPTDRHQAAHSCGMGHESCVNPHHLSWKTPEENQQDKRLHGTAQKHGRLRFKLSMEEVAHIRALAGQKTHDELARLFGVSRRNIGAIIDGRSWGPTSSIVPFSQDEDDMIRTLTEKGYNYSELGRAIGRSQGAVARRATKMGLKSNYDPLTYHLTPRPVIAKR